MFKRDPQLARFYKSKAWRDCRDGYFKSRHGLCERCLKKNLISVGKIVHHKIYLDATNYKNPEVSLNWDNLELLCQDCHNKEHHGSSKEKRYSFDKNGNIVYFD